MHESERFGRRSPRLPSRRPFPPHSMTAVSLIGLRCFMDRAQHCGQGLRAVAIVRQQPLRCQHPEVLRTMDISQIETRKERARAWFETLRDRILAAFEELEDALPATAPLAERAAGRFVRTPWSRADHTGSRPISGLPEVGNVNAGSAKADPDGGGGRRHGHDAGPACSKKWASTSRPSLANSAPEFRKEIKGAADDPRFLATGISLIAHPAQPARARGAHEHPFHRHDQSRGSAAAPTSRPARTPAHAG